MYKYFILIFFFIFSMGFFMSSCTSDKRPLIEIECDDIPPVWNGEVKEIIELTCAYVGCHVGGNGVPGNYTSYGGISTALTRGTFEERTFELKDNPVFGMPPDDADGPKDLTAEQLNILSCWMEAGFPEN